MMTVDPYRWRGDEYQRRLYPYVKDALDIRTFNFYAQTRHFLPPQRPGGGFLDEGERATWERWRKLAKKVPL